MAASPTRARRWGNAVSGVVEAASEMAAAEQLMRRGVTPTD
jgi:MSHA biogenesis protein MshG